jgi:hypothetical protein
MLTSGELFVDAPSDSPLVIHGSYTGAKVRDMKGPVRVAATHARATILNTTRQVDVTAGVIDFSGSSGRVTLSSESEINLKLSAERFDGTLSAWAQRSVRVLIPQGFVTPFTVVVGRAQDFVCRADLCSRVAHRRQGQLHIFTHSGERTAVADPAIQLRSEESTVLSTPGDSRAVAMRSPSRTGGSQCRRRHAGVIIVRIRSDLA